MKLFQGRLRWVLIFWMFLISAIAYLDRVNISIAGQAIQKDFNMDDVQLGWVFSAFVLGYALFQVPGGRMADRFGPRRILLLAVIWWGIFTSLTAATPPSISFAIALLISMRFLLGVGEAVVYPASNSLVARWIPSAERGIANGLIFAGVGQHFWQAAGQRGIGEVAMAVGKHFGLEKWWRNKGEQQGLYTMHSTARRLKKSGCSC